MFNQCDCGSTGGCERCRPLGMAVDQRIVITEEKEYIFPETREEQFIDEDLRKFYEKKGYIF